MGAMVLIIAVVFLLCYLVDKGFTKLFRSKVQHLSGKSVRLSKRYGSIGAIMFALGVAAAFMGLQTCRVLKRIQTKHKTNQGTKGKKH